MCCAAIKASARCDCDGSDSEMDRVLRGRPHGGKVANQCERPCELLVHLLAFVERLLVLHVDGFRGPSLQLDGDRSLPAE